MKIKQQSAQPKVQKKVGTVLTPQELKIVNGAGSKIGRDGGG